MVPFHVSTANTVGAAAASAVGVAGIKSGDVLLSIVKWKATERAQPVAVASFVVADGTITSGSIATNGYYLEVRWASG